MISIYINWVWFYFIVSLLDTMCKVVAKHAVDNVEVWVQDRG